MKIFDKDIWLYSTEIERITFVLKIFETLKSCRFRTALHERRKSHWIHNFDFCRFCLDVPPSGTIWKKNAGLRFAYLSTLSAIRFFKNWQMNKMFS